MAVRATREGEKIAAAILDLLPDDGTPILNRVLRVMLAQRLRQHVSEAEFFAARDRLQEQGRVGRLRGQGGQTFLTSTQPTGGPGPQVEKISELSLMKPLRAFLEGPFRRGLDLPGDAACIVEDTSTGGPAKGKWARPDFILVSAMRFRLLPGCQVDLHSFELKTESGGSVLAIHEALAQTRFTHFGHFVWHLPKGSRSESMLEDIVVHCEEHGIGLIRMFDPKRAAEDDGCEILVDPKRKPTLPAVVDGFLEARLTVHQKDQLATIIGPTR